ncbi:hypothetical protein SAMN04488697_10838 [Pseudomonas sp. 43mfcvi1.1]|uniref:hypothetical protein n=1 Tax=Pseudomonas sp. 43mfcvi1.1 TaxID=1761894 RepID=UPI000D79E3B4|nr:hypothetical protein [Pseudomonas sp. 43mfcvi1.1]PWJ34264.1 hypothetical protein ATJ40_10838 [Pseudomonas sp. 43mfcvi1.1]SSB97410.1 hypothetical protein SAMN04488697_10838 [Pseudomonas sp. 43mfcvi1.1]
MRFIAVSAGFVIVATILNGCSFWSAKEHPIQLSFEDLGADYESRGDAQGHENRTSVNITGLSLPISAGQTVTSPGGELPDLLALPISAQCSKMVVTKFNTDAVYSDVVGIKAALDGLAEQAVEVSVADVKLTLASIGLSKVKGKTAQEAGADLQLSSIAKSIGAKSVDEAGLTAAQSDAFMAKLAAQDKVKTSLAELRKLGGKKNIVVARWSGATQTEGGVGVGSIISADSKTSSKQTGYVILAGIRDTSIRLGKDFVTRVQVEKKQYEDNKDSNDIETMFGDPYIVLFTRAAKYVAYSEQVDMSVALAAKLRLSPEQLTAIGGAGVLDLLKQQELSLGYAIASALAAANQGSLSEPSREEYEYRFWAREVRSKAIEEEQKRLQGYSIIYHNRATIIQARNRIDASSTAANECMHVVPKAGAIADVGIEKLGTEFCLPDRADIPAPTAADPTHTVKWSKVDWSLWRPRGNRCIDLAEDILKR